MKFDTVKMSYICTDFRNKNFPITMTNKIIYSFLFCLTLLVGNNLTAQRHELGIQVGTSVLVGDVGQTNYLFQKPYLDKTLSLGAPVYVGVIYRLNANEQQSFRLSAGYSNVQFVDVDSPDSYRSDRKLYGNNSIYHADLTFEYFFFNINEEYKSKVSPYVFAGIGGMMYDGVVLTSIDQINDKIKPNYETSKKMTVSLPFGLGVKYKFNYNWGLSAEATFRPTFSDMIDFSQIESKVEGVSNDFRRVGNPNSNDWINTASIILSYSFGRPACYCK